MSKTVNKNVSVRFRVIGSDGNSAFGFSFDSENSKYFVDCAAYDFVTKEKFDCLEKSGVLKKKACVSCDGKGESISFSSDGCAVTFEYKEKLRFKCSYKKIFIHTAMEAEFTAELSDGVRCGSTVFLKNVCGSVTVCGKTYSFSSGDTAFLTVSDDFEHLHNSLIFGENGILFSDGALNFRGAEKSLFAASVSHTECGYAYITEFDFGENGKLKFTPFFNDRAVVKDKISGESGDRFFGKISGTLYIDGNITAVSDVPAFYNK